MPSSDRPPSGKINIEIDRFLDDRGRGRHGLHRCARIFERHRNMSCLLQVRAHERDLKQALLRQKAELHRDIGQHHGRIHVAQVIRAEQVVPMQVDFFQAFDGHPHACDPQQRARPHPPHAHRRVAGFVDQRERDADAAANKGRKNEQRVDYDQAPEKGHELLL